jgi:DNA-binding transcriptional MerR regulator
MTVTHELRIGELAARTGRSVHTIRWYDAQGLIPGVVRDASGRRTFNLRHVAWLAFLERLKGTGMTITQMRAYTALVAQGSSKLGRQRELLAAHRERAAKVVEAWQASLALIDVKLAFYDEWIVTGTRPRSEGATRKIAAAARSARASADHRRPPR